MAFVLLQEFKTEDATHKPKNYKSIKRGISRFSVPRPFDIEFDYRICHRTNNRFKNYLVKIASR